MRESVCEVNPTARFNSDDRGVCGVLHGRSACAAGVDCLDIASTDGAWRQRIITLPLSEYLLQVESTNLNL